MKRIGIVFVFCSLVSTTLLWGNSLKIYLKAELAQYLIAEAWAKTLLSGLETKPWNWADTWPVARLQVPEFDEDLYVLAGSQGNSLAFAPGHVEGSAFPEEFGTMVIGGHRDTHFSFLKELKTGSALYLQNKNGDWQYYLVSDKHIVDSREGPWIIDPNLEELHLITCYPFEQLVPSSPLRYVVVANKAPLDYQASVAF